MTVRPLGSRAQFEPVAADEPHSETLIRRDDLSGGRAAPAPEPLMRSVGCEKVTVAFEQSPAT